MVLMAVRVPATFVAMIRRVGLPHAWSTVVAVAMFAGAIIHLGGTGLDFTLLAIDDNISCFAWYGC